ncbi:radical SAM protein [Saccharicrinis fermentans]|uniref:Radical SAM superfamily protein n=1 Tax=Saccharicrinis fermentans DSM 9555 = JCM 21142 TaxID=869213 RepID=W7Y424_9BACT|nr:radical SAM protein [Saccharicrinis fermentans]GAF02812.1 radical SAM superfamily protein [Saccharicrinis fermentans DSM 9555 = JCM 21142]
MGTFLFDKIIFGPVQSRRLGVSLGVNLLPVNKKICTFNCIYCECGFNGDNNTSTSTRMPSRMEVRVELETVLKQMQAENNAPNVITFAGNGEPTVHKDFEHIIDDTIALRNTYFPDAKIAVLSNATRIQKDSVFKALLKVDDNILKLDSGLETTIQLLDQPNPDFSLKKLTEGLMAFKGQAIIQTMFVRGVYQGKKIDNTIDADIKSWLELIQKVSPKSVMIYTIERDTAANGLVKVPLDELKNIAQQTEDLGISTQVSG